MHNIRIQPRIDLSYIYKLHVHKNTLNGTVLSLSQIGSGPNIRNAQQYERDTVGHVETIMHTCWFLVLGLWFIISKAAVTPGLGSLKTALRPL